MIKHPLAEDSTIVPFFFGFVNQKTTLRLPFCGFRPIRQTLHRSKQQKSRAPLRKRGSCNAALEVRLFLLDDFLGVAGDHQLLVGSDDQRTDLGTPGSDLADIALRVLVLFGVDADAQPIHVVADLCTRWRHARRCRR